jgi:hypothetical protein
MEELPVIQAQSQADKADYITGSEQTLMPH